MLVYMTILLIIRVIKLIVYSFQTFIEKDGVFTIKDFISAHLAAEIQFGIRGIKNSLRKESITDHLDFSIGFSPCLSFNFLNELDLLGGEPYFKAGIQYFLTPIGTPKEDGNLPSYYDDKWTEHLLGGRIGIGIRFPTSFGRNFKVEFNYQRGKAFSTIDLSDISYSNFSGFNLATFFEV